MLVLKLVNIMASDVLAPDIAKVSGSGIGFLGKRTLLFDEEIFLITYTTTGVRMIGKYIAFY